MVSNYNDSEIILINTSEIIKIVRYALSKIDRRLIDHGERVGYIANKIRLESKDVSCFDVSKLFILCVLHDIGAYKTNEINDMVSFETESFYDHSLFGYLFLKRTTYLSEYAEAILYHHNDYMSLNSKNCVYAKYAEIIHLADRADILISAGSGDLSAIRPMSGTKFNPEYVEAFFKAEEKYNILHAITSGDYKSETREIESSLDIDSSEIKDYLKLLVYAIDFRSPYTVTHTADTTIISVETGKLMGLSRHELQAIYTGAFLHDIGKIAIPYSILEKPDRLTDDEFKIIKNHITEGENILRGVVNDEICDIALRHHEKLDGSGYPWGFSAKDLTIPQRIVAVADILSALSQKRSYKEPFPKEKVIGILQSMKNDGLICPNITDTVCQHYDMILENVRKSHDPVKVLYNNMMSEYIELISQANIV